METNSTHQEILLVTGTHFASREWNKLDDSGKNQFNANEQLEEACWNGQLAEMLPEICMRNLYLWQIKAGSSFLEIDLGEFPEIKDSFFALDPYTFLATKSMN